MINFLSIEKLNGKTFYYIQNEDIRAKVTHKQFKTVLNEIVNSKFSNQFKRFESDNKTEYYLISSLPAHLK